MELEDGQMKQAVMRLIAAADDSLRQLFPDSEPMSSTVVLKARQLFLSDMYQCLYEGRDGDASVYAEAMVLLSYLVDDKATEPMSSSQGNISAAMGATVDLEKEFITRGYAKSAGHQRLIQFAAKLMYFNASHGYGTNDEIYKSCGCN